MKNRKINVFGKINNEGRLMMQPELTEFIRAWANNRVVAEFEILPDNPSEALTGYYYHYVVPTMKAAFWEGGERMNEQETEYHLRELSPVTCKKEWNDGQWRYETDILNIYDLSSAELVEHIEYIKQMAAEEYSIYIEDPATITNKNSLNFNE